MNELRYIVLKRDKDNLITVDSNLAYQDRDHAGTVMRRRRQERDMSQRVHQYALAVVEMPSEAEFG